MTSVTPLPNRRRALAENGQRIFSCCFCAASCVVCRSCDRGQRYCSDKCRAGARRRQVREAAQRYQRTRHGAEKHRRRQRDYRARSRPRPAGSAAVTHQSPVRSRSASRATAIVSRHGFERVHAPATCCACRSAGNGWYSYFYFRSGEDPDFDIRSRWRTRLKAPRPSNRRTSRPSPTLKATSIR